MFSKNKLFLFLFLFLYSTSLISQVKNLPYSTNWETVEEQNDWTQYRLTPSNLFDWNISQGLISHDYPVGNTNADTIRDWLVSPIINFHSTSKLSMHGNIFALIGVTDADYFGVWFSNGSKDPNDGDYVEILDLTGMNSGTNQFDTSGVEIPLIGSEGYFAFVYEATDNWFTVAVDSVSIIPDSVFTNTNEINFKESIKIFPNPVAELINISLSPQMVLNEIELKIFNNLGQSIFSQPMKNHQVTIDSQTWNEGIYFCQIIKNGLVMDVKKIIRN